MAINPVRLPLTPTQVNSAQSGTKPASTANSPEITFNQVLQTLNNTQSESDNLLQKLAAGEEVDLPQIMIATEQTDISFRVAMAIRDRLVEAYRTVTTMQV
jgi:flagellar hook-basal body complex protein FliE